MLPRLIKSESCNNNVRFNYRAIFQVKKYILLNARGIEIIAFVSENTLTNNERSNRNTFNGLILDGLTAHTRVYCDLIIMYIIMYIILAGILTHTLSLCYV